MQTRKIGTLDVTVVGVGCNNFGRELDEAATRSIIHSALDHGISFFDTADSYGTPKTASESLLGKILEPHRHRVVIATKIGRVLDTTRGGAKPAYVRSATEACLKRLRTDCIDLMQLHIPDPQTPVEETLGALQDLIGEGKIREIGCSNFSAGEIRAAGAAAQAHDLKGFACTQTEFSLLHNRPAAVILQECAQQGINVLPFRPLFHGLLSGKYGNASKIPAASRIGQKSDERKAQILTPQNLAAVDALTDYAESRGHTILELAFAWLLAHDIVPSIIAGVSSAGQVVSNAAAAGWTLSRVEFEEVNSILESLYGPLAT